MPKLTSRPRGLPRPPQSRRRQSQLCALFSLAQDSSTGQGPDSPSMLPVTCRGAREPAHMYKATFLVVY